MMRPVRSRSFAVAALTLLVALSAGACARRYAAGLVAGAPPRDVTSSPAASATTPPPAVKNDGKVAAVAPKPSSTSSRPRAVVPREQPSGSIGTTGVDAVVPDAPTTGGGSPVVTVTTTPGTEAEPTPTGTRALATMISRTLKRPITAVPIGAGFAASAFASVAWYRRRHRVTN
jgi:hypothetical protein